ncbi:pyruvate:ferredoxin (flavodoxin) oxidoreductase [Synergistales bacterium]|nr:pyruvate:ferredoxin (flavodoxin) oxidoreductase [Synergistales bacterium]
MSDYLIVGVGGQGTVLASRLIGMAALNKGLDVRGSETIGMAQRGGSVMSHVRLGSGKHSPLIPLGGADLMLAFEPCEALRALPYLKDGGAMIVCDKPIQPAGGNYDAAEIPERLKARVKNLCVMDGSLIAEKCGAKSLNTAILGAAAALEVIAFSTAEMEAVLEARFGAERAAPNIKALRAGAEIALKAF